MPRKNIFMNSVPQKTVYQVHVGSTTNAIHNSVPAIYNQVYHPQRYRSYNTQSENATKSWEALRNRAYRRLKGKVPPGWKLRIAKKKFNSFYMAGKDPAASNEKLWNDRHFVTATKYLGEKKQAGFPYIKCFLHPKEGPTWTLSNWGVPEMLHKSAHAMLSTSQAEIDQIFKCMDALRDFMNDDPLVQIRANAKAEQISKWS